MSTVDYSGKRSAIIFLASVTVASVLAVSLDGVGAQFYTNQDIVLQEVPKELLSPLPPRELTPQDMEAAERAWTYFALNTQPETGLVNSVHAFPSTTLWDQGSYAFALIAAHRLDLINTTETLERAGAFIASFAAMRLFKEKLPNKAYNTQTLQLTDYANQNLTDGIGWSALDIARLLLAFRSLEKHYPSLSADIHQVVQKWDLASFANEGELWGLTRTSGENAVRQEGRLGYEQYAARAAALWGLDAGPAMSASRNLEWTKVETIQVPRDRRYTSSYQAITPILSEPFLLQAFELGLNKEGEILAYKIYAAQQERYNRHGTPTFVSEDHTDHEPNFVYSSVFSNGEAWAVVDEAGTRYDQLRTLSTKATFGWDALYATGYTQEMRDIIETLPKTGKGWQAGIYESDQTPNSALSLNTNAVILEAIHYKAFGPFLR